jgi:hypothetical protein
MIDTPQKRLSALARRRLPWLRRFTLPIPDGTIDQGDRQQVAFVYRGILAGAAEVVGTLVGTWSNVVRIYSTNQRLGITSANARMDIKSTNKRLEL